MQECTKWKASKHYTTVKTLAFLIAAGPQNWNREVQRSNLGRVFYSSEVTMFLFSTTRAVGLLTSLSNKCLLPNAFRLLLHHTIVRYTIWVTQSVFKLKTKKRLECDLLSRFGQSPEAKMFSRMPDHSKIPVDCSVPALCFDLLVYLFIELDRLWHRLLRSLFFSRVYFCWIISATERKICT
jgi:hypothetical protein